MSELDIYDTANVLSSDEYSSYNEGEGDLMDDAVSSRNTSRKHAADAAAPPAKNMRSISPGKNKLNEIKTLLKKKKCMGSYKKRSIKWLNNKTSREKFRLNMLDMIRNGSLAVKSVKTKPGRDKVHNLKKAEKVATIASIIHDDVDDDDDVADVDEDEDEESEDNFFVGISDASSNEDDTHSDSSHEEDDEEQEDTPRSPKGFPRKLESTHKNVGNGAPLNISDTIELDDTDVECSPTKSNAIEDEESNAKQSKVPLLRNSISMPDETIVLEQQPEEQISKVSTQLIEEVPLKIVAVESASTVAIAPSASPPIKSTKRARSPSPNLEYTQPIIPLEVLEANDENTKSNVINPTQDPMDVDANPNVKPHNQIPKEVKENPTAPEALEDEAKSDNVDVALEEEQDEEDEKNPNSTSLYKQINAMFPKYDEVLTKHLKSPHQNSTIDAIDTNMTRILLDIQTINDLLQSKEQEWNRLLHLKKVKEEILTRLVRKKQIVEIKEKQQNQTNEQSYSLLELKELEIYLSDAKQSGAPLVGAASSALSLSCTAQQLLESRANMKREELELERNITNRLQNILVSSNILPHNENSIVSAGKESNSNALNMSPTIHVGGKNRQSSSSHQYSDNRHHKQSSATINSIGRQGQFKDVKSIIADFRQKNPDLLPRVGKRIKLNEHTFRNLNKACGNLIHTNSDFGDQHNLSMETSNYTPTLEKLLSSSSTPRGMNVQMGNASSLYSAPQHSYKFKNSSDVRNYYGIRNAHAQDDSAGEVSITPINRRNPTQEYKSDMLRSALHSNIEREQKQHNFNKEHEENDVPLCQECNMHEARFVCAGCGNQWYCSRNCQVTAWDKHSELCSE